MFGLSVCVPLVGTQSSLALVLVAANDILQTRFIFQSTIMRWHFMWQTLSSQFAIKVQTSTAATLSVCFAVIASK